MKIIITTTEKKLTKSILKQMPRLPEKFFNTTDVLGIIRSVFKTGDSIVLCEAINGSYYYIETNWRKGIKGMIRKDGKWTQLLELKSLEESYENYSEIVNQAKNLPQIYI